MGPLLTYLPTYHPIHTYTHEHIAEKEDLLIKKRLTRITDGIWERARMTEPEAREEISKSICADLWDLAKELANGEVRDELEEGEEMEEGDDV